MRKHQNAIVAVIAAAMLAIVGCVSTCSTGTDDGRDLRQVEHLAPLARAAAALATSATLDSIDNEQRRDRIESLLRVVASTVAVNVASGEIKLDEVSDWVAETIKSEPVVTSLFRAIVSIVQANVNDHFAGVSDDRAAEVRKAFMIAAADGVLDVVGRELPVVVGGG